MSQTAAFVCLGWHSKKTSFLSARTTKKWPFLRGCRRPSASGSGRTATPVDLVRRRQNVLFRGPAGTGKTMLAKNLGIRALEAGMSVVFTDLSSALADLLRQESLPAVERRLRRYTSVSLLICDELGYHLIDSRAVDLLFQIISRRHDNVSTIITTNLPFKDWVNVFAGAACQVPLVDRFTENLVTFDIHGDSYRQRTKPSPPSPTKPRC